MELTQFFGILSWWLTAVCWCFMPILAPGLIAATYTCIQTFRGKNPGNPILTQLEQWTKIYAALSIIGMWLLAKGCA